MAPRSRLPLTITVTARGIVLLSVKAVMMRWCRRSSSSRAAYVAAAADLTSIKSSKDPCHPEYTDPAFILVRPSSGER